MAITAALICIAKDGELKVISMKFSSKMGQDHQELRIHDETKGVSLDMSQFRGLVSSQFLAVNKFQCWSRSAPYRLETHMPRVRQLDAGNPIEWTFDFPN